MGRVYGAFDGALKRRVALKVLRKRHADSALMQHRFQDEAHLTGTLDHPGIVPVHTIGKLDDGRPFYTMRQVTGGSLREAIDRLYGLGEAPTTPPTGDAFDRERRRLVTALVQAARTLHYAHTRGVLHCDIKPGNLMLGPHGEVLVVDWGLAAELQHVPGPNETADDLAVEPPTQLDIERPNLDRPPSSPGTSAQPTTAGGEADATIIGPEQTETTGHAVPDPPGFSANLDATDSPATRLVPNQNTPTGGGTPGYMAPEQYDGLGMTAASDVYALGATLCAILTGEGPFRSGQTLLEYRSQAASEAYRRPRELRGDVPTELEAIVVKCLHAAPGDRYGSAGEVADDLENWLADRPVSAAKPRLSERSARWIRRNSRGLRWIGLAAATLLLLAAFSLVLLSRLAASEARARAAMTDSRDGMIDLSARVLADQLRDRLHTTAGLVELAAQDEALVEAVASRRPQFGLDAVASRLGDSTLTGDRPLTWAIFDGEGQRLATSGRWPALTSSAIATPNALREPGGSIVVVQGTGDEAASSSNEAETVVAVSDVSNDIPGTEQAAERPGVPGDVSLVFWHPIRDEGRTLATLVAAMPAESLLAESFAVSDGQALYVVAHVARDDAAQVPKETGAANTMRRASEIRELDRIVDADPQAAVMLAQPLSESELARIGEVLEAPGVAGPTQSGDDLPTRFLGRFRDIDPNLPGWSPAGVTRIPLVPGAAERAVAVVVVCGERAMIQRGSLAGQ